MSGKEKISFYVLQIRRAVSNYIPTRQLKKIVLAVLCFICCIWIYRRINRPVFTSAIGCKSKIAQVVLPNNQKRAAYLAPVGTNFHDLEDDFFYFVTTMTVNCESQEHIGPPEEGGWELCLGRRYDIRPPCLIYSFGIGNDFRFEKGVEEFLHCEVHAFDPSMGIDSYQYSDNGFFHNYGIDNIETTIPASGWQLRRLENIMEDLGHKGRTIDYLKMDVEYSEWPALYDIITSGLTKNIRQLALEIHTPEMDIHTRPEHSCTWSTPESVAFMMRTLIELKNSGFSLFHSRTNWRTKFTSPITNRERYCCYNLHFVNTRHEQNRY